jgi:hypothetical protein
MSGQYLRVILRMMCMQCEYECAVSAGHPTHDAYDVYAV